MNALEKKIAEASQKYYSEGNSPHSDAEFDGMVKELEQTNPDSPLLSKVGTGYDINLDSTPGEKVKHKYGPAGSLTKAYTLEEIGPQFKHKVIDASIKLDGMSVVLYYKDGELYQALTRGGDDGSIGIDITEKARVILRGETSLRDRNFTGANRGEIVMSYKNFKEFQKLHPEAKNPRNSTVGLVNGKTIVPEYKYLDIVVYSVVGYEISDPIIDLESELNKFSDMNKVRNWLSENYSNFVGWEHICIEDEHEIKRLENMKEFHKDDYPLDGIVLTAGIEFTSPYDSSTSKYLKYVAQAFKFDAESATTTVKAIEWRNTKSGILMPRIEVETVDISGTNVTYVTGKNAKFIKENLIGPGAIIQISKHGEIIPNVDKVIKTAITTLPMRCPICGAITIYNDVNIICPNTECNDKEEQDLLIWLENLAPVHGLGDNIKLDWLRRWYGTNLSVDVVMEKLSKYTCNVEECGGHRGLMRKMCNILVDTDTKFTISQAFAALNIPRIGEKTCEKLEQLSPHIANYIFNGSIDGRLEQDGTMLEIIKNAIGDANTEMMLKHKEKIKRLKWISDRIDWNLAVFAPYLPQFEKITPSAFSNIKKLDELEFKPLPFKVAITGKLSVPRKQFVSELKQKGYDVGEISNNVKYLITDDPNGNTVKNKKAYKLGITKITEKEFRANFM